MDIAVLLYENFTALDAVGPYEVLSRLPAAQVKFVATKPVPVRTDTRALAITADYGLADVPTPDIIVVPGGPGDEAAAKNGVILEWLRKAHESSRWTTSVCTGALVLGAAGLLDGLEATTHWAAYERLAVYGAKPTARRVVRQGKVITAAGVSAGIDMALTLARLEAGEEVAQAIQLGIEYDPNPPLDAGSPDKAPPRVVQMVRSFLARPS